jgi:hypothetical protein
MALSTVKIWLESVFLKQKVPLAHELPAQAAINLVATQNASTG